VRNSMMGMLKKAASLRQGYGRQASGSMRAEAASRRQVAILPCSRTESTLRASKWLRPCPWKGVLAHLGWAGQTTNFFEHSLPLMRAGLSGASMGHGPSIFNKPLIPDPSKTDMTRRIPHTDLCHNLLIFCAFSFLHRRFIETALALLLIWSPSISAFALAKTPPTSDISLFPLVTKGLEQPVFVTHSGDQGQRLFIVEQAGRIRILTQRRLLASPFLDITDLVNFGGEQGLLGLAFHPQFSNNGRFFVNYSREVDGATVISEFHVSDTPNRAQPTEKILLIISQPYGNHNGGMIAFGPDGFLYIATGDGGAGGDPGNRGQNQTELLGKILRIDINHGTLYSIPRDNPFATQQHGREIFALGFRNPWRFSFDKMTGNLWAADVGQNRWEEVDRVEKGKNYGWRIMEGMHCFKPSTHCPQNGLTLPIAEYANESGRCSITGGYVYRGQRVPHLRSTYIFGDYCSGEIMGLVNDRVTILLSTGLRIASFGEDATGELYVVDHGGGVYRITEPPEAKE